MGWGNSLLPVWHQAITWTNAALLSIGLLGTNFSEIWIGILSFSFKKMHLKMLSAKMATNFSRGRWVTQKWKCCHFKAIFITDCNRRCQSDKFRCSQWWKFYQNNNSVTVKLYLQSTCKALLFKYNEILFSKSTKSHQASFEWSLAA